MYVALQPRASSGRRGSRRSSSRPTDGEKVGALLLSRPGRLRALGPQAADLTSTTEKTPDKPRNLQRTDRDRRPVLRLARADREKKYFDWSMVTATTIMRWRPGSTPQLISNRLKQNGSTPATIDGSSPTSARRPARAPGSPGRANLPDLQRDGADQLEPGGRATTCSPSIGANVGRADYTRVLRKEQLGSRRTRRRAQGLDQTPSAAPQPWIIPRPTRISPRRSPTSSPA